MINIYNNFIISYRHIVVATQYYKVRAMSLTLLFKWQSSFAYPNLFYLVLYSVELALVLNITEILLTGR